MFSIDRIPPIEVFTKQDILLSFTKNGKASISLPPLSDEVLTKLKEGTISLDFSARSTHSQLGISFYIPPEVLKEWYIGNTTSGVWKTEYENHTYQWTKENGKLHVMLPEKLSFLAETADVINAAIAQMRNQCASDIEMGSVFIRIPENLLSEKEIRKEMNDMNINAHFPTISTIYNPALSSKPIGCITIPLIRHDIVSAPVLWEQIILVNKNIKLDTGNPSVDAVIRHGRDALSQIQIDKKVENPTSATIQPEETRVFDISFGSLTCDAEILISTKNGLHLPARYLHALRATSPIQVEILNNTEEPISLADIEIQIVLYKNEEKAQKIAHVDGMRKVSLLHGLGVILSDLVQFENNAQFCSGLGLELQKSTERRNAKILEVENGQKQYSEINKYTNTWFVLHKKQDSQSHGIVGTELSVLRESLKLTKAQGEILITDTLPPSEILEKLPNIKHYIIIPAGTDFTNTYHVETREVNGNIAYILSNTDIKQSRIWQTLETGKTKVPELAWVQEKYKEIFYDRLLGGRYFEKRLHDINRGGNLTQNFSMKESNLDHIVSSLEYAIEYAIFLKQHKNEKFDNLLEEEIRMLRETGMFEEGESSESIYIKSIFLGFIDHDTGELQKGATQDAVDKKDGKPNQGDEDEAKTAQEWINLTRDKKFRQLQTLLYDFFENKRLVMKDGSIIASSFIGNTIRHFDKRDPAHKYTNRKLLSNAQGMNFFEAVLMDTMSISGIRSDFFQQVFPILKDLIKTQENAICKDFFTAVFSNAFKKLAITLPKMYELSDEGGKTKMREGIQREFQEFAPYFPAQLLDNVIQTILQTITDNDAIAAMNILHNLKASDFLSSQPINE